MATIKAIVGARTAFTITLNSLANATYVASSALDLTTPDPLDVMIDVGLTPGTVSGNKQARVFLQTSIDGTNYSTGPTSGTTTTDEPNLLALGVVPLNSNATLQRRIFSVMAALGYIPTHAKLVVFNDSGAAFAASGCDAYYATVVGDSA